MCTWWRWLWLPSYMAIDDDEAPNAIARTTINETVDDDEAPNAITRTTINELIDDDGGQLHVVSVDGCQLRYASWGALVAGIGYQLRPDQDLRALSALVVHGIPGLFQGPGAWGSDPRALASACPSLQRLEIVCCPDIGPMTDAQLELPPGLKTLLVTHSGLSIFEASLPESLRTLDIRLNRLQHIPVCLESTDWTVTSGRVLTMSGNDMWFEHNMNVPLSRVTRDTVGELIRANDLGMVSSQALQRALNSLNDPHQHTVRLRATTYTDAQSVHKTGVQTSVRLAVALVMAHAPDTPYDPRAMLRLAKAAAGSGKILRRWCAESLTKHAVLDVTMSSMCERLALLLEALPDAGMRQEAYKAITHEVQANANVCQTGRITHLMGALTGLVPGFAVGPSAREALQDAMAGVRNRWARSNPSNLDGYVTGAMPEAMQLLEDMCIPEDDQGVWLDAL